MLIIGILSAFNNINSNNISLICQINSYKTLFIIYYNNLSLYNLIYLILQHNTTVKSARWTPYYVEPTFSLGCLLSYQICFSFF